MNRDSASTDPKVLEMLVCPLTKTRLVWTRDTDELISVAARLAFPVRDGIPQMVVEEARALTEEEVHRIEIDSPGGPADEDSDLV